jgi:hypothetical protein
VLLFVGVVRVGLSSSLVFRCYPSRGCFIVLTMHLFIDFIYFHCYSFMKFFWMYPELSVDSLTIVSWYIILIAVKYCLHLFPLT